MYFSHFWMTKVRVPVFNIIKALICSDFYYTGIRTGTICISSCTATREATISAGKTKKPKTCIFEREESREQQKESLTNYFR